MSKYCLNCGAQLAPNENICGSCGTPTPTAATPAFATPAVTKTATNIAANVAFASAAAGEMRFSHDLPATGNLSATGGPFRFLLQSFLGLFRGFGAAFKDRKCWVPALLLALLWFILTLLPLLDVNPRAVRWLSFLTFAHGGTSGGITGLVGGVMGKGVFAYFLISLVLPLTRGQKSFSGVGSGLKQFFPVIGVKSPAQLAPLLVGMGAALIFYNFMTGMALIQNSMAGIAAFLLSLRALSGKAGFLRGFLAALTAPKTAEGSLNNVVVNRIIAGIAAGFALSVLLSSLNFVRFQLPYALGVLLLIAGLILKIAVRRATEEEA